MKLGYEKKAQFFHELARAIAGGLTFPEALRRKAAGRFGSSGGLAREMLAGAQGPETEAYFDAGGAAFTALDRGILSAGSAVGRLGEVCDDLANYYQSLAATRAKIIHALIYPVVVMHLAAAFLELPKAIFEGIEPALISMFQVLGVFYGLGILAWIGFAAAKLAMRRNPEFEAVGLRIPVIGSLWRSSTAGRFSRLVAIQTQSGLGLIRSLEWAGPICGSPTLENAALKTAEVLRSGASVSEAVAEVNGFPEALIHAFHTGELSGRFDQEFSRASEFYQDKFNRHLETIARLLPKMIVLLVGGYLAWKIISIYMGQINLAKSLLDGM